MDKINALRKDLIYEIKEHILPFWINYVYNKNGGYYGRITSDLKIDKDAPISLVMCARILWTFSASYKIFKKEEYAIQAYNAKAFLIEHFIDKKYGGAYWSIDNNYHPLDKKKQFYAIGFAIYGLSEYYNTFKDESALLYSIELFKIIEKYSKDNRNDGYIEALNEDWSEIKDLRLSNKDANEPKTMNTHLHIIEAYSNLYKVWKDPDLEKSIENLLNIFIYKIKQSNNHLGLFFDNNWNRKDNIISYGHDIEASWLLYEAAIGIEKKEFINIIKDISKDIAYASLEGLQNDGSMIYELKNETIIDSERHWWVQAETLVGEIYLWKIHKDLEFREKAIQTWLYIKNNLISLYGEWYWSILPDGSPNIENDLAGFWKCPYHNSRACLETIKLLDEE